METDNRKKEEHIHNSIETSTNVERNHKNSEKYVLVNIKDKRFFATSEP